MHTTLSCCSKGRQNIKILYGFWRKFNQYWALLVFKWLFIPWFIIMWKFLWVLLRFPLNNIAFDLEEAFFRLLSHDNIRILSDFFGLKIQKIKMLLIKTAQFGIYCLCRVLIGISVSQFLLTSTLMKYVNSYLSIDLLFTTQSF